MFGDKKNITFLSIMDGKIVRRVPQDTPKSISRVNKKGDTVWEMRYDNVEGTIQDILVEDTTWGKQWAIFIRGEENGQEVIAKLSFGYNSKPATCFLSCIENADVSRPITFSPKENKDMKDGKEVKSTTLFLNQDGKGIKWAHTSKEPNGMPQAKEAMVNGQKVWDNTAKLEFFEKLIAENILPKIRGNHESPAEIKVQEVNEEQKDDLPF